MPGVEDCDLVFSESGKAAADLGDGAFPVAGGRFFGEEEVGIGDDLFLHGPGQHLAHRQWKALVADILYCQADADVPFADQGVAWQTLPLQNLAAQNAVTDVGVVAKTADSRDGGMENAYVMEQGGFFHKGDIHRSVIFQPARYGNGLFGHPGAVAKQNSMGLGTRRVVFFDQS